MSVFAGPPLWGVLDGAQSNIFPLPLRVDKLALGGVPVGIAVENGVLERPLAIYRGVAEELSFAIPGANLGRPYYVGKPGPLRNLPLNAAVFVSAEKVYLICPASSRTPASELGLTAPTGHKIVEVSPLRRAYDFATGESFVYVKLDDFVSSGNFLLLGITFSPALFAATPV